MALFEIRNVKVSGISAGVPKHVECNLNYHVSDNYTPEAFVESTGVLERRIGDFTTSDLCYAAAEKLITDLNWDKNDIDALIFVSQMGDYILPATACVLHGRLGLNKECMAFDIPLGCSGWVYGMNNAASLISTGCVKKLLLCTGDAKRRAIYDDPLFGFAGTVTALEYSEGDEGLKFHLGTDGKNYDAIIIPDGGARNPVSPTSFIPHEFEGKMILPLQSHMKGMDVFSFGFSTAPKSVRRLAEYFCFDYHDADYFVFHQANMKMNNLIAKKLKLPEEKVPSCIYHFGNTSSASIPLTIVTQLGNKVNERPTKFICCGFGVGLSWGTVCFETSKDFIISELVEIE